MGAIEGKGAPPARTLELKRGEAAPKALAGIDEVARGFDSLFSGLLVSELTRPLQAAGFGGTGPGASVIQGLIETHLSDHLSKGPGLGIGRMVAESMERYLGAAAKAGAKEGNERNESKEAVEGTR
jgi:Rod binding domain-containing protein